MNIVELVRKEVQQALARLAAPQSGTVTSIDAETHSAKVELELTGTETGWLRLVSNAGGKRAGAGMRMPKEGDEVLCIFTDFDHDNGFIIGYVPNEDDEPANGSDDAAGNIDKDALVVAQWENGGRLVVENSRDGSAPIVRLTNNQGDMMKIENGEVEIYVDNGKFVRIGDSGAKLLAYADQTDARLDKLESHALSHVHPGGVITGPPTPPFIAGFAGGYLPGQSVTTSKIKGK